MDQSSKNKARHLVAAKKITKQNINEEQVEFFHPTKSKCVPLRMIRLLMILNLIEQIDHGRFELLQMRIDAFANVLVDERGEPDAVLANVAGL